MTVQDIDREFRSRLDILRRRQIAADLLRGVLQTAATAVAAVVFAAGAEAALHLDVLPRTLLAAAAAAVVLASALWTIGRPLLRRSGILPGPSDETLAARVGVTVPEVRDRLVNLLQLGHDPSAERDYSGTLISEALIRGQEEFRGIDFASAVDRTPLRRWGQRTAAVAAGALAIFLLLPGTFRDASFRLLHFSRSFTPPPPFTFLVEPGNRDVVRGETVPVRIRLNGAQLPELVLASRPRGQQTTEEQVLHAGADGWFRTEFPSLRITTVYAARAGGLESDEYTLAVVERPVVTSLRLRLTFPAYTRLPARDLEEHAGDVTALKGTRVTFRIEANKPLAAAALVFADSAETRLTNDGSRASGEITVVRDRRYVLKLTDAEGRTNADPIAYTIRAVADAVPTADILVPGANIDIAENTRMTLLIRITDDYGFSSLRLAHRLSQSRYEQPAPDFSFTAIPLPPGTQTEATITHVWPLSDLHLVPEDVITYYVEVLDNDRVTGPKSGRSEVYTLRLPSMEEVFADLDKGHEAGLEEMKQAVDQAREARRELEELQQDLRKDPGKSGWEERKKAEQLARQYEEIQKKLDAATATVDAMVQEMQKNQVLSRETLEKYQELQQLMQEMTTPEFADALKKFQQAMEQVSPEELRQALQQFSFSEENFRKSVERTMQLLKRMQIEQKADELVKRAEELKKQQEELEHRTEQTDPADRQRLEDLAARQQKLQEELERLAREMQDLRRKMEEFPGEMPMEEMDRAEEEMDRSGIDEQMAQSAEQLRQQHPRASRQRQQEAMRGLGNMMQRLSEMQQAMRQNQQREVVNAMRRALQDLLALSRRQEELKNQARTLEPNSQGFRENAQQQKDVLRDLGRVTEGLGRVSQRSFGVTPEMGKALGDAMRSMDQAMQALEQRNGAAAGDAQEGAMASLNAAAGMVQGSLSGMMQSGGQGMGMAGFMQRLQQMSGMQQGINQGTRNLGGMTPQRAAELGRLAGEQGMVRKSMEQLAREAAGAGELSKMLGDLNRVAQDMREVQTDLAQGNVNPETLRKQDRILSRLLDSQRSTRERDFEKKRRAESGKDVARTSPGPLDPRGQGPTRLQQDLLKALEEGYAPDYQELIRRYFEALEQEQPRR